jgi:hypothetical protein
MIFVLIIMTILNFASCVSKPETEIYPNGVHMSADEIASIMKKENNLVLFTSEEDNHEFYILGTIHGDHFDHVNNYSLANIQSVIDTIKPDLLLIETRPETLEKYDALDGPIEMIFVWAYAKEHGYNIQGIDWWKIEAGTQANSTTNVRDDNIYNNIIKSSETSQKILIICGAMHRIELRQRFSNNGYIQGELNSIDRYFNKISEDDFMYPQTMITEIRKKIQYFQTGIIDEINSAFPIDSEENINWIQQSNGLIADHEEKIDKYIKQNRLY